MAWAAAFSRTAYTELRPFSICATLAQKQAPLLLSAPAFKKAIRGPLSLKSKSGTFLQKAAMFELGDALASAAKTSKIGVQKMYLEVTVGPVGDKVQLILQATHIPQVVKCPTAA